MEISSPSTPLEPLTATPGLLRVPGWERFPWLRAGFSTRQGGRSAVYGAGEQNLGWTAEDDAEIVGANRQAFIAALGSDAPLQLATVQQVHSGRVRDLERELPPLMTEKGKARLEGDGMISRRPGRLLAILTADCVPVIVADTKTHAVGAFHAGWRGTLARIVENGIAEMRAQYGSEPQDVVAAIGPCIHACCFEVGREVRALFDEKMKYAADLFTSAGTASLHMDLVAANRRQLLEAGLAETSITVVGGCTACSHLEDGRRQFFSYRAEQGRTGRMLSGIAALA